MRSGIFEFTIYQFYHIKLIIPERLHGRLCDSLHATCTIPDGLYEQLQAILSDEAIIEALMLAGNYRTVAYITEGLRLPLERFGRRFPAR